jgi:O-phosphoseryl-tRNA(Cys) synthetase
MSNQVNAFCKIENKKLKITNKEVINEWLKNQSEGDDIVLRFTNQKDFRSTRQIRLLYKLFREMSKFTGETVENIKLLMKHHLGMCYNHTIQGETITVCKSISDLTKAEINEMIEQVDIYANQTLGLQILNFDDKKFLKDEI